MKSSVSIESRNSKPARYSVDYLSKSFDVSVGPVEYSTHGSRVQRKLNSIITKNAATPQKVIGLRVHPYDPIF